MGLKARHNIADPSKTEVGEIDTRAPFASVRAAVSLFGATPVSPDKPIVRKTKPSPDETTLADETELHLVQKEINKLKDQLKNAEATRIQTVAELEKAKRMVEDLTNKIKIINESKESALRAAETAKIQTEQCKEVKSGSSPENGLGWKIELDNTREQYTIISSELDSAKLELRHIKKDYEASRDAKVSAFHQEAEAQKLADANMEKTAQLSKEISAAKESLVHVELASTQAQQEESKILTGKANSQQGYRKNLDETAKKLDSLKKEFDPEFIIDLEMKLSEKESEIGVLQNQLKTAKNSDPSFVKSVDKGLDGANEVLHRALEEECSMRTLVESIRLELETIRKEQLELKEKESQAESVVASLQIKLQEEKAELDNANSRELKAQAEHDELVSAFHKLSTDSENARKEAETAKYNADELRKDADAVRVTLNEVEKKLHDALREAEEAKAAEARVIGQMKAMSQKANEARSSMLESGTTITISVKEYESLNHIVNESGALAEMKVAATSAQVEAIKASENEAVSKSEAIQMEMKHLKSETAEALKRADMAEAARNAVEGELRKWREMEQKTAKDDSFEVSSESHNPEERIEGKSKSEKTSATKKTLLPQLSGIFHKKKSQAEGGSLSCLPGEKPA